MKTNEDTGTLSVGGSAARRILAFAWFSVWMAIAFYSYVGPSKSESLRTVEPIAVAPPSTIETAPAAPDYVAIQEVTLGRRALGSNPARSEVDESLPDPDPETWREVRLSMLKENGDRLRIELLRPLDWLADNAASVGSTVHLDLEEMGASGPATVTYVGPCPPIQPGQGNVVTGRFLHESSVNLLDLHVDGDSEPVGVTDNHPYWSVDRQAFIEAGSLEIGETVDTLAGPRAIVSIAPRPVDEAVYNLEIHREHVYRVGDLGTLVHNECVMVRYVSKLEAERSLARQGLHFRAIAPK